MAIEIFEILFLFPKFDYGYTVSVSSIVIVVCLKDKNINLFLQPYGIIHNFIKQNISSSMFFHKYSQRYLYENLLNEIKHLQLIEYIQNYP